MATDMDINQAIEIVRTVRSRVRREVYGIADGETYNIGIEPGIATTVGQVLQLLREKPRPLVTAEYLKHGRQDGIAEIQREQNEDLVRRLRRAAQYPLTELTSALAEEAAEALEPLIGIDDGTGETKG